MHTPRIGDIVLVARIAPGQKSAEAVPGIITSVIAESTAPDIWAVGVTTFATATQDATIYSNMNLYATAEAADEDRAKNDRADNYDPAPVYAILRPEARETHDDAAETSDGSKKHSGVGTPRKGTDGASR